MSHYGIVKRQKYWLKPKWKEEDVFIYMFRDSVIKYESKEYNYPLNTYYNLIQDIKGKGLVMTFWEGKVKQEPLGIGEILTVNNEKLTVNMVEKDVDGSVTYYVDDLFEKVENYAELLAECEKKYEEYSNELKFKTEEHQQSEKLEKTKENPFTDPVQIKSRWKRFFWMKVD